MARTGISRISECGFPTPLICLPTGRHIAGKHEISGKQIPQT
jgi:hypothetical protein